MTRRQELVLAALAPANGRTHSPVQVQKLFFLLDRNIPTLLSGPLFAFGPYNYGPFDRAVYDELDALARQGAVEVSAEGTWKNYSLTREGQALGEAVYATLDSKAQEYIGAVNNFVRSLSFTQLISAIYKAYPEMRANSVFQE